MKNILFLLTTLMLIGCANINTYEVCDSKGNCTRVAVERVFPDAVGSQVCYQGKCEFVPANRLLFKEGTDKKYCNGHYNANDFVDNWWNAEGLIDECEMPVGSNMQFVFKQHNQTIHSYTGTIQVLIQSINYDNDFKALQIFTGEDNDKDNLPDSWIHCGNIDEIQGISAKIIHCKGTNLKFVKMVNAEWNKGSLYIDYLEVLKVS